ncbi:MAG TPA: hypothetical protein VEL51_05255 [Vicinamibacterales bacterium]|nr:hypothetical protein [Vicinamibacterales bacterium]
MQFIRRVAAPALLLALGFTADGSAQGAQLNYADLFQLNGKVIAKGSSTNPVGPYGVKTYRIEELTLAPGTKINVNGTTVEALTAWRVTIVGTSFQVRDLAAVISIDSTNLLPAQESTDQQEISAITLTRTLIHDGATIALSYGEERTQVPETVKLGSVR